MGTIPACAGEPRAPHGQHGMPCRARINAAEEALSEYLTRMDAAYGAKEERRALSLAGAALPGATAGAHSCN